jgi:hypothetical protein
MRASHAQHSSDQTSGTDVDRGRGLPAAAVNGGRAVGADRLDGRRAAGAESVGTENLGSRIGVGGTGYILGLGYTRSVSRQLKISAGIQHLSTHLTRDLDQ